MRSLGFLVAICIAMAALKAAAAVLVLAVIAMIIFSALIQPQQTFGCLMLFLCIGIIERHPLIAIPALAGLAAVGLLAEKKAERKEPD